MSVSRSRTLRSEIEATEKKQVQWVWKWTALGYLESGQESGGATSHSIPSVQMHNTMQQKGILGGWRRSVFRAYQAGLGLGLNKMPPPRQSTGRAPLAESITSQAPDRGGES